MIRKFLVCGKQQILLQQQVLDGVKEIGRVVELLMPVQTLWDLEKDIQELKLLLASGESSPEITSAYKKALRTCAQYALREEDRLWLYLHGKEKK